MVSDIGLLEEKPQAVKDSIAAYVGCLGGALMKGDYLGTVKAAGFRDVKVIDETHFPVDYMANDPTAQAIMKDVPRETLRRVAGAAASVKVHAVKPQE